MIMLRNVWFAYRNGQYVLKNVSLDFEEGVIVVRGPNGAGKTTLLKLSSLLLKPNKGSVIVDGIDFWKLRKKEKESLRRKVVYVHEKPYLFKGTVYDNIAYPLKIRGYSLDRVKNVSKEFGIAEYLNASTDKLSAGIRQLVALARAFVFEPKYVFLDEPFANLDDENKLKVLNIIEKYVQEGVTVAIASHIDVDFERNVAVKTVFMSNGRIVKVLKH